MPATSSPPSATSSRTSSRCCSGHCERLGRDPSEIYKTIIGGGDPFGDPDGFLREMEAYAALGIDHVQVRAPAPDPVGSIAGLADHVIPRLHELG